MSENHIDDLLEPQRLAALILLLPRHHKTVRRGAGISWLKNVEQHGLQRGVPEWTGEMDAAVRKQAPRC